MAMTEEERRKARNEASKRWYLAHKAAKAAQNKLPKAKKAEIKPATKQAKAAKAQPKSADTEKLAKSVEKFADKYVKAAGAYRGLVKSAAEILADVYKSGDEKLVAKACKTFGKKLSLEVKACPEDGKAEVAPSIGAKTFRIPKVKAADPEPEEPAEEEEQEKVVAVDPSLLTGIEEGTVTAGDVDSHAAKSDDYDEDEDEDEYADLDDIDPDDMTPEQYDRYREREARREQEEWDEGRADAMRELDEQGSFDGYED